MGGCKLQDSKDTILYDLWDKFLNRVYIITHEYTEEFL